MVTDLEWGYLSLNEFDECFEDTLKLHMGIKLIPYWCM